MSCLRSASLIFVENIQSNVVDTNFGGLDFYIGNIESLKACKIVDVDLYRLLIQTFCKRCIVYLETDILDFDVFLINNKVRFLYNQMHYFDNEWIDGSRESGYTAEDVFLHTENNETDTKFD